jgi:hypothetical protein
MRIWCIKIGIVLVLHFKPWVDRGLRWWTVSPRGSLQLSSYVHVLRYLLKNMNMNKTVKKKSNLQIYIKTKDYLPHAKLYPSTDLGQFHGTVFVFFSALIHFTIFIFRISNFFGLSTTEETLVVKRNAHLVHQNWYRIRFTCKLEMPIISPISSSTRLKFMFIACIIHGMRKRI